MRLAVEPESARGAENPGEHGRRRLVNRRIADDEPLGVCVRDAGVVGERLCAPTARLQHIGDGVAGRRNPVVGMECVGRLRWPPM